MIEENPGTINDAYFVCDPNEASQWEDTPAAYHAGGGCLSYADGHSEIKVWHDHGALAVQNRQVTSRRLRDERRRTHAGIYGGTMLRLDP